MWLIHIDALQNDRYAKENVNTKRWAHMIECKFAFSANE